METGAMIMDIQRFSIHDGPGIRTTVFLKGCHMKCQWCHNPESQYKQPELMFFEDRCIGCGKCNAFCKNGICKPHLIAGITDKHIVYEPNLQECQNCENNTICADNCPSGALCLCGHKMSVQEVMDEVIKDLDFYETDGGVTFSGGEPLLQKEFLTEILPECAKKKISVCLDTTLEVPWKIIEPLLEYVSLFLVDIKILNPELAYKYQGRAYQYMPENLKKLSEWNIPVIIRIPLLPGVNDTLEEIQQREAIIKALTNVVRVDSFYVSNHGRSKYKALQKKILWKF